MDTEEDYVGQLKEVFDECDSSRTGAIDKHDLVILCERLQVQDHSSALMERLIGSRDNKRIGFDEFKDGFVAVLSQCADLISTDDDVSGNSFYDDAAVSPKFVRDGKKYGRRSRPENQGSDTPLDFADISDMEMDNSYSSRSHTPAPDPRIQQHHNTPVGQQVNPLESPMEEQSAQILSQMDSSMADVYEGEGLVNRSIGAGASKASLTNPSETEALKEIWENQGVGKDGFLTCKELGSICANMGMENLSEKELEELFEKLDADNDGKVSFDEFVRGLNEYEGHVDGLSNSRPHSSQSKKLKHNGSMSFDTSERRTQTPSILSAIIGSGYFSSIDAEVTGYAQPEDIIEYWESFGISHEDTLNILELLEFDTSSRINLQELSSTLEQELVNHDQQDSVYQAALYSCKHELKYLKGVVESGSAEKEKLLQEVEATKRRNEVIIKEADERHSNQEKQAEIKLNSLEEKYREHIKSIQTQLDVERELLTSNAQAEKHRLETELSHMKEEERRLRQELAFNKNELSNIEKELHAHVDKNVLMAKENERIKRELSSLTEMNQKKDQESAVKFEEMESQREKLTSEKNRFSEQRIQELEDENKALRDQNDELTLEIEEAKMTSSKRGSKSEGQRSRRGSLLSDYTQTKDENTEQQTSDSEGPDAKLRKLETSHAEEQLQIEILRLKNLHAEKVDKLKRSAEKELAALKEAFNKEKLDKEQKHKKEILKLEKQLDEEKHGRNSSESDWRRKHETEKAQLKLTASRDRKELVDKLQEEHRQHMKELRDDLNTKFNKELLALKEQHNQEKDLLETRLQKKIANYETIMDRGAECLYGKLREDFYRLVEEQTQNEVEVEKRHLEATYQIDRQADRDELYELLNKEKQSMEDQFNERLYELEDQIDDTEENVRAQCEDEFMAQIAVVQDAFNDERLDYEGQISELKREIQHLERRLKTAISEAEMEELREQRDQAFNSRDDIQLEKNKMMLERNRAQKELERLKKTYEREKKILQGQIDELQKEISMDQPSVHITEQDTILTQAIPENQDSASLPVDNSANARYQISADLIEENTTLTKKLNDAEERVFKLSTDLKLVKSQHLREVQDLKLSSSKNVSRDQVDGLEEELRRERRKCQELEEALKHRSVQGRQLLINSEDQHNKVLINLTYERDEYKTRLLATRNSLAEVTEKLKQQMMKNIKSDELARDLYVENANLVEALYITEKRQKSAENHHLKLQDKCDVISHAYRRFVPAVMEAVSQG